jgi:hypothetical protein
MPTVLRSSRWVPLLAGVLGLVNCSNPEGPTTVFGTYHLTAYSDGASDLPLPYVQEASTSPSDTDKVYGGSLTLKPDSTWTNVWQRVYCQSGVCGALRSDTLHGTFGHYTPGDSAGTMLLMRTWPYVDSPGPALVRGRRLELYGFWIYERD